MIELTSTELVSSDEENKKSDVSQKPKPNKITDQDILDTIRQDQNAAFARYRKLVQARREREKLRPREPEVYHHNICRKS